MKDIILPIKCSTVQRIAVLGIQILAMLVIAKMYLFAIIDDPFWVAKIGTIGDMPDYHGRFVFFVAILFSVSYLVMYAMVKAWRIPIRCRCDK